MCPMGRAVPCSGIPGLLARSAAALKARCRASRRRRSRRKPPGRRSLGIAPHRNRAGAGNPSRRRNRCRDGCPPPNLPSPCHRRSGGAPASQYGMISRSARAENPAARLHSSYSVRLHRDHHDRLRRQRRGKSVGGCFESREFDGRHRVRVIEGIMRVHFRSRQDASRKLFAFPPCNWQATSAGRFGSTLHNVTWITPAGSRETEALTAGISPRPARNWPSATRWEGASRHDAPCTFQTRGRWASRSSFPGRSGASIAAH